MSARNIDLPALEETTSCVDKFVYRCGGPKPLTWVERIFWVSVYALAWASAASFLGYVIAGDLALSRDAYKAFRCDVPSESQTAEPWRVARSEAP